MHLEFSRHLWEACGVVSCESFWLNLHWRMHSCWQCSWEMNLCVLEGEGVGHTTSTHTLPNWLHTISVTSFPGLPPSLFFSLCLFHLHVLYWTQTEGQRWGRPGNEATTLVWLNNQPTTPEIMGSLKSVHTHCTGCVVYVALWMCACVATWWLRTFSRGEHAPLALCSRPALWNRLE